MQKVSDIEHLEVKAEKSLESARNKAAEIVTKANEESRKILSSSIDVNHVKAECKKIVDTAKKEAEEKLQESRKEAENLKTSATRKVDDIIARMTKLITGA